MRRIFVTIAAVLALTLGGSAGISAADLLATYPVERQPFGIVADPLDGRVYVANSGSVTPSGTGHISAIDPVSGNVTTLDTTKPAGLLALDSAGRRLYSSNYLQSNDSVSLDVFDLSLGSRLASLDVGGLGIALDKTRERLYAAGGRYLASIDTATYAMDVRTAPFPQSWFGVAVDPALGRVFVTNIDSSAPSLVVLDAGDLHTIANVSLPSVPRFALDLDVSRHLVYVGGADPTDPSGSGHVSVLDASSLALRSGSVSFSPAGIAVWPDLGRLWATDSSHRAVVEMDATTLTPVGPATQLSWQPYGVHLAAGGLLYVGGFDASLVAAFRVGAANHAPTIDSFTLSPMDPATRDTLTATVVAHDDDPGDSVTIAYEWRVNDVVLIDEHTATLDLSKPGHGDRNQSVCVSVSASDGKAATTDLKCTVVRSTAPVASVTLDDAAPKTNGVLHATATASDVDGDTLTYVFTWRVNGVLVRSAFSATPSDQLDLSGPNNGSVGDTITVTVVASDDLLESAPASASARVANSLPSVSVTLREDPWKHDKIQATAIVFDLDAQDFTYAFTWWLNGVAKGSGTVFANTTTLDLRAVRANNGDVITIDVTASDGFANASASASTTVTPPGH